MCTAVRRSEGRRRWEVLCLSELWLLLSLGVGLSLSVRLSLSVGHLLLLAKVFLCLRLSKVLCEWRTISTVNRSNT